jgi:hypothetical protein
MSEIEYFLCKECGSGCRVSELVAVSFERTVYTVGIEQPEKVSSEKVLTCPFCGSFRLARARREVCTGAQLGSVERFYELS